MMPLIIAEEIRGIIRDMRKICAKRGITKSGVEKSVESEFERIRTSISGSSWSQGRGSSELDGPCERSVHRASRNEGGGVKKEGGNEICVRVYAWVCMCVRYSAAQRERKVSGNTFQVVRRAA